MANTRLSLFLPALALLLAAAPLHAQSIWSATLTVQEYSDPDDPLLGCGTQTECSSALTSSSFTYGGESYTYREIGLSRAGGLTVCLDKANSHNLWTTTLRIGSENFPRSSSVSFNFNRGGSTDYCSIWGLTGLSWTAGGSVSLSLVLSPPNVVDGSLRVTAGDGRLDLNWPKPLGTVTGYDVEYRQSGTSAWTDAGHSGTATSQAITSLTNGRSYDVRVRAENSSGAGSWVQNTGRPHGDTTAPAVLRFVPANGTTTSNAGTNIKLTFTEVIRKDNANTDFTGHADLSAVLRLRRGSSNGAAIPYTASLDGTKRVITINPSSNLPEGNVYVAVTDGYYDTSGNQGRASSATFTVDTTAPTVSTFDPANGTTTSNAGTDITLRLTEAIRKDGLNADFTGHADLASILTLKTGTSTGNNITYTASINSAKTIITINPSSNLPEGDVYVAVTDGYYDTGGNQGRASSATFTVDTTAPTVSTFNPANGTTTSNAGTDITLTFTEVIRKDNANTDFTGHADLSAVLRLRRGSSNGAAIPYTASINSAKTIITINPSSNLPEGNVYVAVTDGYYNAHGTQGAPANATFTVDTTGVAAPTFNPANGTTTSNAGTDITLTFTEAIRKDNANTDFTGHADLSAVLRLRRGSSNGAAIPYTASINSAKTVITLNPSSNLPEGGVYVAISNAYYDTHGNQGEATNATFTVDTVVTPNVPSFGSAAVADQSYTQNTAVAALVLPAATGGDGTLTYRMTPSPPPGLTLDVVTRTLSGTPSRAQGARQYTWMVTDADGDTDEITFAITVATNPQRARVQTAVKRALAAVARRAMSSALDNIGARFGNIGASDLTLAGSTMMAAADGPCEADRFGVLFGCMETRRRSLTAGELFGTSAFSLHLGTAKSAVNPATPLWSVWGRGDFGTFAGRGERGLSYDGKLRTGWLGLDARAGTWVAGLAISHGTGEADYGFADQGHLETTLTALYPYGRWTLDSGLELRGVVGAGTGKARHEPENEERETGDLSMRMASLGLRHTLSEVAGMVLALRGDASITQLETDDGPDTINGLSADSWRLRAGLEASQRFTLEDETALEPFLEVAARQDGGDGLEGSGVELAGGLRYHAPGLAIEARGRWLATHSDDGAQEQGVSLTARAGPGAGGRGLFFALEPRWGAATDDTQALWSKTGAPSAASGRETAALDAQLGYGFGTARGLLTPFAQTGLAGDARHLRLGARFEAWGAAFGGELAGERNEHGTHDPEHALRLDLQLRF